MHAAFGQQRFRFRPSAAEAFEQENCVRELFTHAGRDVLPDRHWNLITRVATEAVHAATAPREKRVGQTVPQRAITFIQFHQVFPRHAPGARTDEGSAFVAQKPLRMVLLQAGHPSRVIDDKIENEPRPL